MKDTIQNVCQAFRIQGEFLGYKEIKRGHINQTYRADFVRTDGKRKSYIVQAINTEVFQKPVEVMENIDLVTEYLHAKMPGRTVLHFHHTAQRLTWWRGENGFWRLFNFIPSYTYDASTDPTVLRSAGRAFGEFQMLLSDFDAGMLHETIPHFHDTIKRYADLEEAVRKDPLGRLAEVRDEVDWLLSVKDTACQLTILQRAGELPLRVTHNDTKINNVLFDETGREAIVVIDLDTVMPGLVGHDFGDAVRFAANTAEEDSTDLRKVSIDLGLYQAFAEGFLSMTAGALTPAEKNTLAISCVCMTVEVALRFLEDHLLGDTYFRISHPGHNLERARCQIALAKSMLEHIDEMVEIAERCLQKLK